MSGRVHPGETNSSWIMEGFLDMITADTSHAQVTHTHTNNFTTLSAYLWYRWILNFLMFNLLHALELHVAI